MAGKLYRRKKSSRIFLLLDLLDDRGKLVELLYWGISIQKSSLKVDRCLDFPWLAFPTGAVTGTFSILRTLCVIPASNALILGISKPDYLGVSFMEKDFLYEGMASKVWEPIYTWTHPQS